MIYRTIWKLDRKPGNGGARVVSAADARLDPHAEVILDEQVKASGKRELDLAPRPLFRWVDPRLLERPTYLALRRLFDNYEVNYRAVELSTPEELAEERAFIEAIDRTEVMDAAFDYIATRLRPGLSRSRFREEVRDIWFTRYTNYYDRPPIHHCSGFEHVFVGEGRYPPGGGVRARGEVSGYHSWVKFHLDEAAGRVDFRGHKYGLEGGEGPDDPRVASLQMLWNHRDNPRENPRERVVRLFKRKGGFFVGSSPEAEIALGTVAFYESVAGLVEDEEVPITLGEDGRVIRLVIYRNVLPSGRRGAYIRSVFPRYLGSSLSPESARGSDSRAPSSGG
ncbi:MAG: hypothetical protein R6X02_18790 [Enhygromyxa sp.]